MAEMRTLCIHNEERLVALVRQSPGDFSVNRAAIELQMTPMRIRRCQTWHRYLSGSAPVSAEFAVVLKAPQTRNDASEGGLWCCGYLA
jgi:hypothetical protein